MPLSIRSRTLFGLLLSAIAAISAVQTVGILPGIVSADNTVVLQLSLAQGNTEPATATGQIVINVETGQTNAQLNGATPLSLYAVMFVSASASTQLGLLSTGNEGNGNMQAFLSAGTYAGHFEVLRLGTVQFTSSDVSVTITASASGTISTTMTTASSSTETSTSQTTSQTATTQVSITETGQVVFQVEPPFASVNAGAFAKFNIRVVTPAVSASVLLVARNVPPRSVAIFSPNIGQSSPEFLSTLTLVTSGDTPAGSYGVTVTGIVNGQEFDSQITLQVSSQSTITQSSTFTISAAASLSVSVETDRRLYGPNATVYLFGHVKDNSGSAVAGANVAVQVDTPTGGEITFQTNLSTDAAGVFTVTVNIPGDAPPGTYTAFASATKAGYASTTTHTTFVVGSTTTPSVVIKDVYVTDTAGARSSVFSAGQTVLVWVVVENDGAPFQGVIWVQIRDPNGTPVTIQLQISNLNTGEAVKVAFGFQVLANLTLGLYTANALVSDKLISQGGTFLASADTQFALTG